jgi:hypothetical protein
MAPLTSLFLKLQIRDSSGKPQWYRKEKRFSLIAGISKRGFKCTNAPDPKNRETAIV